MNTTQSSEKLKFLLAKNFDLIFDDFNLFITFIPDMAKLVGLPRFLDQMNFTYNRYYLRINNPDKWQISELMKAKRIFQEYNLGT